MSMICSRSSREASVAGAEQGGRWSMRNQQEKSHLGSVGHRRLWILLFILFLALPCSMWDLNSLPRDWTHASCIGSTVFNHLTAGPPGKLLLWNSLTNYLLTAHFQNQSSLWQGFEKPSGLSATGGHHWKLDLGSYYKTVLQRILDRSPVSDFW